MGVLLTEYRLDAASQLHHKEQLRHRLRRTQGV